jgi:hypothetical protein
MRVAERDRRFLVSRSWRVLKAAASFRSRLNVLLRRVAAIITGR